MGNLVTRKPPWVFREIALESVVDPRSMDDLEKLNRQIASHWLGHLDAEQEAYLDYTSVCLGHLTHSATEIPRTLDPPNPDRLNSLLVARLNRRYLRFARLAATEAAAGHSWEEAQGDRDGRPVTAGPKGGGRRSRPGVP